MISPDYCKMMARYNHWMNNRLYEVCAGLDDDVRKENKQLFFHSIHGMLNHLLFGDIAWLSRFLQHEDNIPELGKELFADFNELRTARLQWDKQIQQWADTVDEQWLGSAFSFTSKVDGVSRTFPAWKLATHLFNHGTHHRGQLTTVLTQLGLDYGSTDIPFMPENV